MPKRVTPKRLYDKIAGHIQEANRQGVRVQVVYLNPVDLNRITPGQVVNLLGVTLTASTAVPSEHYCLCTDMEEVRHISQERCRPLL